MEQMNNHGGKALEGFGFLMTGELGLGAEPGAFGESCRAIARTMAVQPATVARLAGYLGPAAGGSAPDWARLRGLARARIAGHQSPPDFLIFIKRAGQPSAHRQGSQWSEGDTRGGCFLTASRAAASKLSGS